MSRAARTPSQHTRGTPKKMTRNRTTAIIGAGASLQRPGEGGHGGADLVGRVLLDEVQTGHRDFGLVGPAAAELPLLADQDRAWLGVDEQLRGRVVAG